MGESAFGIWLAKAGAAQFAVKVLINVAISAIVNKISARGLDDKDKGQRQLTINVRGTVEHQRILYGETLAGGMLVWIGTASQFGEVLYQDIVVAAHECEDITDMWIDQIAIPSAAIDWAGDGSVDSGDFRGKFSEASPVYFNKYLGADGQTSPIKLPDNFTEINTTTFRGQGQTHFVVQLNYNKQQSQVWSAGHPNAIRALVKGKKVYDPRSDSTQSFGTGPHRLVNSLTWEWSDNPALCWADYKIDSNLGFEEDSSKVDYGYVASAAEICDGIIYTPVGTDKRFRCNGTLFSSDTYKHNIQKILSSMNGSSVLQNGLWKVRAWGYETPTLQFSDRDLRRNIKIQLHPVEKDRYNEVRGTFIDKDRNWEQTTFPAALSSEYFSRDNNQKLVRDIDLKMTTDIYMAQRLAIGILEESDLEISAVLPTNYKTTPAEVAGTLMYSNKKLGWVDKVFSIEQFDFREVDGIDVQIREDNAGAYTDVGTADYTEITSLGTYLPNSGGVAAPTSLWVIDGINQVNIYWTPPAPRQYESIELYVNSSSNVLSDAILLYAGKDNTFAHRLEKSGIQYYWNRSVDYAGQLSAFLPNSNATDVIGFPSEYESRHDYTFDKGSHLNDFWTEVGHIANNFRSTLVTTEGQLNTQAVRFINSYETINVIDIRGNNPHQITTNSMGLRLHYRVNSYDGFSDVDSFGIMIRALAWNQAPSPPRIPPAMPSSGTYNVMDTLHVPVSSLTSTGSWAVLDVIMSQDSAWLAGHKLGNVAFGVYQDAGNSGSSYIDVYIDNMTLRYLG